MKLKNLTNNIKFKANRKSPELLMVGGVVGIVVSTVMACRASRKVDEVIQEHVNRKEEIDAEDHEAFNEGLEYNRKRERTKNVMHTGMAFAKLYGPSITLGILSLGCIFRSNNILKKRNIALAAAYKTLDDGFRKYRERVIEHLGEDVERRIRLGAREETIEVKTVDKNGKEKTKKEKVEVIDTDNLDYSLSPYARLFDELSTKWQDDPEYNRFFLDQTQNYANDYLIAHGYLFLNQVYEWLGFKKTLAGQQVGWIYDPKNGSGDNYVDFGIRTIYKRGTAGDPVAKQFINNMEPVIWLDFNVDGLIMNEAFDIEV